MFPADHGNIRGKLIAFDSVTGQTKWAVNEMFQVYSGPLTTDAGVLFYGTLDGWFKAVDARSGKPLWQFKLGSGIVGSPISFAGPDGRQYIAICDGIGGDWFLLAGDVRSDDPADVRPPADFIPDIARRTSQGGTVWVFALGAGAGGGP